MKYLFSLIALLLIPTVASAQWGGVIGVYPEQCACHCLMGDGPGPKTMFVIQRFSLGSLSSKFRIEFSPGFTGTLVGVTAPDGGTWTGEVDAGTTVDYGGACRTGSFVVLELSLMLYGTSEECSWIRAAPHPSSIDGKLDSFDCEGIRLPAEWQGAHVQHDFFLTCPDLLGPIHSGPGCYPIEEPLPVESATWGAVKALYR